MSQRVYVYTSKQTTVLAIITKSFPYTVRGSTSQRPPTEPQRGTLLPQRSRKQTGLLVPWWMASILKRKEAHYFILARR